MKFLAGIIMTIAFTFIGCSEDRTYIYNPAPLPDSTVVCDDEPDSPIPPFNICELKVLNKNGRIIHTFTVSEILVYKSDCIVFRTYSGKLKKIQNKKFILIPCE